MINKEENERKNVQLLNLYNENKDGFQKKIPKNRITTIKKKHSC